VNMKLSEGVFHIPTLGQEFQGATATIVADRSGIVRITDLKARAQRGQITGSATARIPRFSFQGADVKLKIAEGQEIPLTLEGVPFGTARGELDIHAEKHDRSLDVKVAIPEMQLDLPKAAGRRVQPLEDNPDVVPSHPLDQAGAREPRPADALDVAMTL